MAVDKIIKGGEIVTSEGSYKSDMAISDEKIVGIGSEGALPEAEQYIDASGLLVLPGIVDPHVHIQDHFSMDSFETATRAAARGGVTTVIDFAWLAWVGELSDFDTEGTLTEGLDRKKQKAANALIDYGFHGAITREDPDVLDEIQELVDRGVTSFKIFTAYEIGLSNGFMDQLFETVASNDAVAVLHTEDDSVCEARTNKLKKEEKGDSKWYPDSRPDYAEAMAAYDAIQLAVEHECRYYGIHTSCEKSAQVVSAFRNQYPDLIRGETCTHYTTLDRSIYEELGNLPMIAPPIRSPSDIEAIFEYLRGEELDVVSTDHCAYTRETKQVKNWWDSSFGANSLQVSLPVFYDEAVNNRDYSPSFVVSKMCTNPAKLFGMKHKGTFEIGTDADIVVFDPDKQWTISSENNESVSDFSIYESKELTGAVDKTIVRGELVVDSGEIVGTPGHGEYVNRNIPNW